MLSKLLYKEFKLALHPAAVLFLLLSSMMLIPNYPMYVLFFYNTLGIFFICLSGRENHDFAYSLSLPIRKRDAVCARIVFAVILQLAQCVLAVGFMFARRALGLGANEAGMDPNVAFFGLSFIMLAVFNYVFFTGYFSQPDKVGRVFARASIVTFIYIGIAETCAFAVPFFRDVLDTPDPENMGTKCIILAIGAVIYGLTSYVVYRISAKKFEALDM